MEWLDRLNQSTYRVEKKEIQAFTEVPLVETIYYSYSKQVRYSDAVITAA